MRWRRFRADLAVGVIPDGAVTEAAALIFRRCFRCSGFGVEVFVAVEASSSGRTLENRLKPLEMDAQVLWAEIVSLSFPRSLSVC